MEQDEEFCISYRVYYEDVKLTTARSGRRQGVTSQKLVSA